jgi:hypothetical protein
VLKPLKKDLNWLREKLKRGASLPTSCIQYVFLLEKSEIKSKSAELAGLLLDFG